MFKLKTLTTFFAVVLLSGLVTTASFAEDSNTVNVVSASSLQFALKDIATNFEAETGKKVALTFSASGNAYRQILQGAPFEIFLSANEDFVLDLTKAEKTEGDSLLYAVGRLVLFASENSPVKVDAELKDVKAALQDGRIKHFAIANPEHAPYGVAAREALKNQGLWDSMSDKIVMGENVSQTAQFISTGSAEAGLIPYSLVLSPKSANLGKYVLLPEAWHNPINQRMALLKGAGDTAKVFYDYLQSPKSQEVFAKYGFVMPEKKD
ncbi:MAG: molybdate ABC transporter substrate-binding protein [Alphaproteobacteria bacterium]